MCLERVTKVYDKPYRPKTEVYAWKAFVVSTAGLCFPYRAEYAVETGVWMQRHGGFIPYGTGKSYLAGFHAFVKRADAVQWARQRCYTSVIRRVRVRGILAKGGYNIPPLISYADALVAAEMFVPKYRRISKKRLDTARKE